MPLTIPPLILNNMLEVTHFATDTLTGCEIINRHHARVTAVPGTPTSTVLQAATAYLNSWVTNFTPLFPVDYVMTKTVVIQIAAVTRGTPTPSRPHPTVQTNGFAAEALSSSAGLNPGAALPVIDTVSMRLKTLVSGRYWRGGLHLSPVNASSVMGANANKLTAAAQVAYETAVLNYRQPLIIVGGTTLQMEIFSPTFYAWVLPGGSFLDEASTTIVSQEANPYLKHQVSRQPPHVP